MAPSAIQWRAKDGIKEVKVDGEDMLEYTVKIPLKILLPCKTFCCSPKAEKVKLHIFNKAAKIWEKKFHGVELEFKILEFDTKATVASVIEKVLAKARCGSMHPWAVTEVIEAGEGEWTKGTTVPYASEKAAGTLASFGWISGRGKQMPPVWLTVHKAK